MELTFNLTEDRREPLKPQSLKDFELTFGNGSGVNVQSSNWVQGRLQMDNLRQVFVNIQQGKDNEPFDITGYILQFCGRTPFDGKQQSYRVIDNSSVVVDGLHGRFRYTFPAQAFAVAGTYKQAYFRLIRLSDYKCIATLEFDLSVLEDFVFADMVPSDYISPFNDILNQLLDGEKKFKADTQTLYEEAAKRLNDAVTQLTQLGTDVKTTLTTEQAALQQLIEKIKENNLLTQADLDKFSELINSKLAELNKKITDLANSVEVIRQMGRNNAGLLQYKMVSVTTSPNFPLVTDTQLDHLKNIGASLALIDMVNITTAQDSNPQRSDGQAMLSLIKRATSKGITINMLKPHIGINYSDGFDRGNYQPSDMAGFFDAWKNILLQYAQIAADNNIPILCIGCEQFHTTDPSLLGYWKEIIGTIKTKFPKLLLTYAFSWWELFFAYNYQMSQYLDFIGLNCYPRYLPGNYTDSTTEDDLAKAWGCDTNGDNFLAKIDYLAGKYHKHILITEIGVVSMAGGLSQITPAEYNPSVDDSSDEHRNFKIASLVMRAFFDNVCCDRNVVGFAWWHLHTPFNFFTESAETTNQSIAEQTFADYVKGGLI